MTGRPVTPREIRRRILKALIFLAVVIAPMAIFGAVPVYAVTMGAAAIITTAFPLVYSAVAPWWRYSLGRVIFGSVATIALLIDFTVWRLLAPDSDGSWVVWLGALLWASLAAHIAGLTRQLIRAQHQGKSRDLDGTTKTGA